MKDSVIKVSKTAPHYFEQDGKGWIPVGCNICFARRAATDEETREYFDRWLRTFAANGGNCIRLWAGHTSLEVMPETPGVFDQEKTKTLLGILHLCEELGIKIKITFESFRLCMPRETAAAMKNPEGVTFSYYVAFNRPLYAPYAANMTEFFHSEKCREIYLMKADYFRKLGFGDSPAMYCWELWNEINCTAPIDIYSKWSTKMLADLKEMFPKQLVVQNLGSFSDVGAYQMYDQMATEPNNDFMQIHRYIDTGGCLDICRAPMDVLAAGSIREMLDRRNDCPAILAETGAVQPNHTGPFPYYMFDRNGTLLHDAIFAAFFAGSAGCGQFWHWDHQYIDGNNLWWHFKRFANAIDGLDPVAENFRPLYTESRRLRMYGLKGRTISIFWCRDKKNSWRDELIDDARPELLDHENVPFTNCKLDCYLPWEDRHVTVDAPTLPPFQRSIVFKVPSTAVEGIVRPH